MSSIVDAFLDFLKLLDNIVKWVCIILTGSNVCGCFTSGVCRLLPVPKPP